MPSDAATGPHPTTPPLLTRVQSFHHEALLYAGEDCHPEEGQQGGYGLWIANQLCELVQVRTFATGSVVRLHLRLA